MPRRRSASAVLVALIIVCGCEPDEWDSPVFFRPFDSGRLASTPPMGWSSWNAFGCDIDEDLIKAQADAMVETGMRELGYTYVNIDDCWMAAERNGDDELVADPARFPGGIAALARYVHRRGLKLGIYSSPGPRTCNGLPGSEDHEEIDAETFAAWGVDYLKYDRCSASKEDAIESFQRMRAALHDTGRPIVFSINPNGATWDRPWRDVAHLWRTTPDIKPEWSSACSWWCGIVEIADINERLARAAGPGGWNDPDMLEVGVRADGYAGLTAGEARLHMSLWAIMAAPLIAGADLQALDPDAAAIYTHPEIIAIDQDPLGMQGWRVRDEGDAEVWSRPLHVPGTRAIALVNQSSRSRRITARWNEVFLADEPVAVRDVWARRDLGAHDAGYTAEVPAHDVVVLEVVGTPASKSYEAESPANVVEGGARVAACATCSGAQKVSHVGNGGILRFREVTSPSAGTRHLTIVYATEERRSATLRINGGDPIALTFASSGGYDTPSRIDVSVPLAAGDNTIELMNPDGWSPDIDRIEIE
jgi:alpha-galactosidase